MQRRLYRQFQQGLAKLDERLANAEAYVARNINIKGNGFLHLDDWKGNSGHPKWMKNVLIPRTKQSRARVEKLIERVDDKEKQMRLAKRRKNRVHESADRTAADPCDAM
ncbi:MAG TPA: hypothetical protein VHR72_04965 [Gemmataceae bacterium]|jgi:hypothetical protein|nr:hypothetical protein [Gemmataceae bacterium]